MKSQGEWEEERMKGWLRTWREKKKLRRHLVIQLRYY